MTFPKHNGVNSLTLKRALRHFSCSTFSSLLIEIDVQTAVHVFSSISLRRQPGFLSTSLRRWHEGKHISRYVKQIGEERERTEEEEISLSELIAQ